MLILLFMLLLISVVLNFYFYAKTQGYKPHGDVVIIHKDDGKTLFSLELNEQPTDFHKKKLLIFKVVDELEDTERAS